MALLNWLTLSLTEGLGPVLIGRMVEGVGSAAAAAAMGPAELRQVEGIGSTKAATIAASLRTATDRAGRELESADKLGIKLLCPEDGQWPALLRTIHDPPPVLYMRGALEDRDLNGIGIVGSRRCTLYGREQADRFGALLAGAGFTIISGGARGIDSAAHRGALRPAGGRTIAVLGSGLDVPYPPENQPLFDMIAGHGAVLSEFPLGTIPSPENFPRRNRIVSGLSRAVLVIEADKRSGALITARLAGEQGRGVLALPGRVDSAMSVGAHQLIRDGATLVSCLEDVYQELGPLPQGTAEPTLFDNATQPVAEAPIAAKAPAALTLSESQRLIVEQFEQQPLTVDELIERTGLPVPAVLQELTTLSLKGVIRRVEGQTYARASGASHATAS